MKNNNYMIENISKIKLIVKNGFDDLKKKVTRKLKYRRIYKFYKNYIAEVGYDFASIHPEIGEYDIVYSHFNNQYYIAIKDYMDPWSYNPYRLVGGNLFPEESYNFWEFSHYYIEKVKRRKVPKNILKALDELIELFKTGRYNPWDDGKTIKVHRKICEAQGVEFIGYI